MYHQNKETVNYVWATSTTLKLKKQTWIIIVSLITKIKGQCFQLKERIQNQQMYKTAKSLRAQGFYRLIPNKLEMGNIKTRY